MLRVRTPVQAVRVHLGCSKCGVALLLKRIDLTGLRHYVCRICLAEEATMDPYPLVEYVEYSATPPDARTSRGESGTPSVP